MLALLLPALSTLADPLPEHFPFVLPALDASAGYVDMSFLSPEPAGADGFVTIRDGHFLDGGGRRLWFLGTNVTFSGAFPAKEVAPLTAARLRKFGFNLVRFHHMDNSKAPRGIWADDAQTSLDPQQLDRLDWFIAQLKQCGIYADLNLHVSRTYAGFGIGDLPRTFRYGKVLDNFHPRLLALQQEYATALLTHRNPYTGNTYAAEPAVAMIEINNENTLVGNANNADLLRLPPELLAPLVDGWRAWVKGQYGTLAKAAAAWQGEVEALGAELLTNGDFAGGTTRWTLEAPRPAEATMQVVPDAGPQGGPALRAVMTRPGVEAWHFQIHQVGLTLTEGATYTLSFWCRADREREITVGARLDQPDWHGVGDTGRILLTPRWTRHRLLFQAVNTVPQHVRISFNHGNVPGTVELAQVSLRPGAEVELPAGASLDTLDLPIGRGLPGERRDWLSYVAETERAYTEAMIHHVKDTIGAKAAVTCTQASYGGMLGVLREGDLSDYVDMHSYWQHPAFPGRPWDPENWRIGNTPLVESADGGTLRRLAQYRVAGKPFTVSEYDHPSPSLYNAELFPVVASFAALQDWDGLMQFDYGDPQPDEEPRLRGYFQMANHPGKLVFAPLAALMLRDGAVPAARSESVLEVPRASVVGLGNDGNSVAGAWAAVGAPGLFAQSRLAIELTDDGGEPKLRGPAGQRYDDGAYTAPTASFSWRPGPEGQAELRMAAERVAIIVGRIAGRTVTAGPLTVALEPTPRNYATVALAALDGQPIASSRKLLLCICGAVTNQDMGWNEALNSVGRQWGHGPPVAEALHAQVGLTVAPGLSVKALDGSGVPIQPVASRRDGDRLVFAVDPADQTLWYAIAD